MTEIDKPIRRLNIKVSLALLSLLLKLSCAVGVGGEFPSALWTICLFSCVVFGRSFALHSFGCSVLCRLFNLILCAGDICLLFKLVLKFRNGLKHSEGRSCFASLLFKYQRRHPH